MSNFAQSAPVNGCSLRSHEAHDAGDFLANQRGELIMITMMTFAPFFVVALAFSGLITVLMSGAIDVQ